MRLKCKLRFIIFCFLKTLLLLGPPGKKKKEIKALIAFNNFLNFIKTLGPLRPG